MCLAVLVLLCTVLLSTNKWTSAALMLSPCGPDMTLEVVENTISVFTCSGAAESDTVLWRFKIRTMTGFTDMSYCNPIQSGQTAGTCSNNIPAFIATRPSTGTSLMTVTDSPTTNNILFEGSTLLCRRTTETDNQGDNCLMDHVAIPQSPSCSKTDVTQWRVRTSCSVTQVYSYLNRYTCQLYQTSPGSATPSLVVNMTTSGSGKYKSGTCDVSVTMPTVTGTYSYKAVITPGRLDVTAGTIQIRRPSPSHNCPQYVAEGQDLSCTCGGDSGSPPGVLRWHHAPSSTQLTLTDVKRNQTGTRYTCQAVWNGGVMQDDHDYTLNVAYGPNTPAVTSSSDPLDTNGSRDLTLNCSASQVNPAPPVYSWTRASSSDVIHTGQRYTFKPHPPEHDGSVYQCHAQNSFTQMATTGTVTVRLNYPPTKDPVITTSDNDLYQGDRVTLTCTVTGGKPVSATTVTFTCPGKTDSPDIPVGPNTTTSSVTFDSLSDADQDKQCTCNTKWKQTDWYTRTKHTRILFSTPPSSPDITVPSTGYPFIAGESGTLTCVSSTPGRPTATYTWPVTGGGQSGTDKQGRGTLTFDTVSREDDGKTVRCKAGNLYTDNRQPVADGTLTLRVYYNPLITVHPLTGSSQCDLTSDPTSCEVTEGQGLHINCTSDSNPAPASTVWKKDGAVLVSSSILSIDVTNHTDHTGQYSCHVTTGSLTGHPGREPLTAAHTLAVLVKYPTMVTHLTVNSQSHNVTVNESDTVYMECRADGRPTPTMRLVNTDSGQEKNYTDGGHVTLEDRDSWLTYTLSQADCEDAGIYMCAAGNDVNNAHTTHNVTLFVNCRPRDSPSDRVPEVNYRGTPVTLALDIVAYPTPDTFHLSYLGVQDNDVGSVTDVTDNRLTITCSSTRTVYLTTCIVTVNNMTEADAGFYNVRVGNVYGDGDVRFRVLSSEHEPDRNDGLSTGTAVGVTAVVFVVVIVVMVVAFFVWIWRRHWILPCSDRVAARRMSDDVIRGQIMDMNSVEGNTSAEYTGSADQAPSVYDELKTREVGMTSHYSSLQACANSGNGDQKNHVYENSASSAH